MGIKECIDLIKQASNNKLKVSEITELIEYIAKTKDMIKLQNKIGPLNENLLAEINKTVLQIKRAAAIEKRNQLLNAIAESKFMNFTEGFKDPTESVQAFLVGSNRVTEGSRASVSAQIHGNQRAFLGAIIDELKTAEVYEAYLSKQNGLHIAEELFQLSRTDQGQATPGITKNPEAIKIAKIFNKYQKALVNRQNMAGASISNLDGYITKQTHSSEKLFKAGFQKWKEDILQYLDVDRTFDGVPPEVVDDMLEESFLGLISGQHSVANGVNVSDFISAFKGPGNLAKRLSRSREFHFKDAASWYNYNEVYGEGPIEETLVKTITYGTRNAVLMENMGTNPEAFLDGVIEKLKAKNRDNPELHAKLSNDFYKTLYNQVSGKLDQVSSGNYSVYHVSNVILKNNALSKLGGAVLSAFSDIPLWASELTYQGAHPFTAYAEAFKNVIGARPKEEVALMARTMGAGIDGMIGSFLSRFDTPDSSPGISSSLMKTFFKLTGLQQWTDAHKQGIAHYMASYLGEHIGVEFKDLNESTQRMLTLYGISDNEWSLINSAGIGKNPALFGNKAFLTPDQIDLIPDDLIDMYFLSNVKNLDEDEIKRLIPRERQQLKNKIQAMFFDRGNFAVVSPGDLEAAQMSGGLPRGNMFREGLMHLTQFKSFPLSVVNKVTGPYGREALGRGHEPSGVLGTGAYVDMLKSMDSLGFVGLLAQLMVFGYLSKAAKDIARGKKPADPTKPEVMAASFSQGGGLGLYGDFLLGEYDRFGRSFLESTTGPTFATISDLARIKSRLVSGDDAAALSLRTLINNTPFVNLFYTRTALDYLLIYQLQEMINPGYISRMERDIMENNGQEYFLPPSQVITPGYADNSLGDLPERMLDTANRIGEQSVGRN